MTSGVCVTSSARCDQAPSRYAFTVTLVCRQAPYARCLTIRDYRRALETFARIWPRK